MNRVIGKNVAENWIKVTSDDIKIEYDYGYLTNTQEFFTSEFIKKHNLSNCNGVYAWVYDVTKDIYLTELIEDECGYIQFKLGLLSDVIAFQVVKKPEIPNI